MSIHTVWLLLLVMLIGACSREESLICTKESAYLAARSAGQLRIPEGLTVPDETEALRVPEPASPVAPEESEESQQDCLQFPPSLAGAQ